MRALVYQVGPSVRARLIDYDVVASGATYDDAMYNLQTQMARHVTACDQAGIHEVWIPRTTSLVECVPPALRYIESWERGTPQLYAEYIFRFEGSKIELPFLNVRIEL